MSTGDPGVPARTTLAPAPRGQPLPQVATVVQSCAVCQGQRELGRGHWFWERLAKRAGFRSRDQERHYMEGLYQKYRGRCPGCGGHGKVIIVYDPTTGQPVGEPLHYDDRGMAPDELAYLKKLNPTA